MNEVTWNGNLEGNAANKLKNFKNSGKTFAWSEEIPKKGRQYFRDQRSSFSKDGLIAAAEEFRASAPGTEVTDSMKKLQFGFLVPPTPRPVFTKMVETESDRAGALYADDRFCLFLNREVPYPECYSGAGKYSNAGMSLVHMLACPNERIYNAVSLRPEDVDILEYMKKKVLELMKDPSFKQKAIDQLNPKMDAYPELADEYHADRDKFLATGPDQLRFYFHIHPNHSVGHLHMHCLQNNLRTSFIGEYKNAKYDDIVAVLTSTNNV
jgi:hypothetical protein